MIQIALSLQAVGEMEFWKPQQDGSLSRSSIFLIYFVLRVCSEFTVHFSWFFSVATLLIEVLDGEHLGLAGRM